MQVETETVIEGRIVNKVGTMKEITIYQQQSGDDTSAELYFVRNEIVIGTMDITADCGQNVGYIANIDITNI